MSEVPPVSRNGLWWLRFRGCNESEVHSTSRTLSTRFMQTTETGFTQVTAMTAPTQVEGAITCICQDDVEATRMLI